MAGGVTGALALSLQTGVTYGAVNAILCGIALLVFWRAANWRGVMLVAALVQVHGAWEMDARLRSRVLAPQTLQGVELHITEVQARESSVLLVADDNDRQRRYRLSQARSADVPAAGQCILADLRLKPPRGNVNSYGFDYAGWLYAENVTGVGWVSAWRPCASPASPAQVDWSGANMWSELPATPGRALLKALVVADRSELDREHWSVLNRSGTSHLFAISGLHVGIVAVLGGLLTTALWKVARGLQLAMPRRRAMLLGAFLSVAAYMVLAMGQISAQRAGISALLITLLLLSGRRIHPLRAWLWALLLVLLVDPFAVLKPAFALSFTAAALLIVLAPTLRQLGRWRALVVLQFVLGLGLAPLVFFHFDQWSFIGLGLNLLLVPAMALFLPVALVSALLAALGVPQPLGLSANALDLIFDGLSQLAASPAAVVEAPLNGITYAVMAISLMFVAMSAGNALRAHSRVMFLLAAACALMLGLRPLPAPAPGTARLWMKDVGQGQALLLQTARHWVVVDPGPVSPWGRYDAGAMVLLPHLRAFGAKEVAVMVVTHSDLDHAGGANAITAKMAVSDVWGAGGRDCESSPRWEADGVIMQAISTGAQRSWTDNDRSCVVMLTVGNRHVLLTGDIQARAEAGLLDRLKQLELRGDLLPKSFDVVTVPHHGSRSSSGMELIRRTHPGWALVSAGAGNRWGLPKQDVLRRWRRVEAEVLQTTRGGEIRFDLPTMRVYRPALRPWHDFSRPANREQVDRTAPSPTIMGG